MNTRAYDVRRAAFLDYRLGVLIRSTCLGWNQHSLDERREFVKQYLALLAEFHSLVGRSASITCPWTDNELDVDIGGFRSCLHEASPLENAARVTERVLRKHRKAPATLDSRLYVRGPLDPVPHAKTLEEIEAMHIARLRDTPKGAVRVSESAREREWLSIAERRAR